MMLIYMDRCLLKEILKVGMIISTMVSMLTAGSTWTG